MVWAAASWYSRATIRTAASIRIPSSTSRLVRGVGSEIGSCYRSLPATPDDRLDFFGLAVLVLAAASATLSCAVASVSVTAAWALVTVVGRPIAWPSP